MKIADEWLLEAVVAASGPDGLLPLGETDTLPPANPFRWAWPYLDVSNGTWRKELRNDGSFIEVENREEDPLEALKEQVAAAVREAAEIRGWQP